MEAVSPMKAMATPSKRTQYITKLPSSALLSHSVASVFDSYASVATLRFNKTRSHTAVEKMLQAATGLDESESWRLLRSQQDPLVWTIFETVKVSSPSPTETSTPDASVDLTGSPVESNTGILNLGKTNALSDLIAVLEPFVSVPVAVARHKILKEASLLPAVLDSARVEIEIFKAKIGSTASVVDLARVFFSTIVPSEITEDVCLELQEDLSDANLFSLHYNFRSDAAADALHSSEGWTRWRRSLVALVEGRTTRHVWCSIYHTHRALAGVTSFEMPEVELPTSASRAELREKEQPSAGVAADGTALILADPKLTAHVDTFRERFAEYEHLKKHLTACPEGGAPGSLLAFARTYRHFGLRRVEAPTAGWRYRDWVPTAASVALIGDFNGWVPDAHMLTKESEDEWGSDVWSIFLPDKLGVPAFRHENRWKVRITPSEKESFDRLSPWVSVAWHSDTTHLFDGVVWDPPEIFTFRHPKPVRQSNLKIYEAHVGSCSSEEKVASYQEMRDGLLPRISRLGYNALLLVGVPEHAWYPSMGWHVASYYAPSSRFGTPDDFKRLVDEAHRRGISILMSVVTSHGAPTVSDGLFNFNTIESSGCYFRQGQAGRHPVWDGHVFDFENPHVIQFLLGMLAWYMDEYSVDGFRFEGVTSLLYHHHGINNAWDEADSYDTYFNYDSDMHATHFLMLANEVIHGIDPSSISIANDRSAHPTLCGAVGDGGLGFDFRTAHFVPGAWIQMILEADEHFSVQRLMEQLTGPTRPAEKLVAYAESYDTLVRGKRPLKIAMFAWESLLTHAVGGVAPHVTELAAGLARLGHEVHVFVRATGSVSSHAVHYGVHYHECPFELSSDFVSEVSSMCRSFIHHMHQTEQFMKEKFSICHAHDWLAAKALVDAAASGHMCIQTMHSTEYGRCGNNAYGGVSQRIHDIEAEGCATAGRVICVSGVLAEEVTRLYGVHPGKIKVIYNGINASHFDAIEDAAATKQKYGIGVMDPVFLFVGRMATQKGPDLLIEAVPHILSHRSDAKFVIVGDGHLSDGLQKRVGQLGIGHACKLIGRCGGPPLLSLFKACDAVVVPSRNEPFGIVVLEAWSAHKPVVATTCGGPRDFVTHDVDGFLVDPCPGSISWGCCKILDNFDHARWMGSRGRVKAAFSFSWDTISNQTRDCYNEQLARADGAYCESPRGDSSLASRLMGSSIFENMTVFDGNETVARGLALHKMIRLMTIAYCGAAYMSTMGTEFGQPEFVDLPRSGNNNSFHHARTRWDLADDTLLKFKHFELFDAALIRLEECLRWLAAPREELVVCHDEDQVVAFQRGVALFVFNFHSWKTYEDYQVGHGLEDADLTIVLSSDDNRYGGSGKVPNFGKLRSLKAPHNGRPLSVGVTIPARACLIVTGAARGARLSESTKSLHADADGFIAALKEFSNLGARLI